MKLKSVSVLELSFYEQMKMGDSFRKMIIIFAFLLSASNTEMTLFTLKVLMFLDYICLQGCVPYLYSD